MGGGLSRWCPLRGYHRLTPFCPFRAKAYVCDFRCIATVPASFHSPLQQLVNQHIDASLWAYCPSGQQGSERGRAFPTCFPMTLRSLETLVTLRTLSDGSRHYATRFGVEMGGGLSRWCPLRGYHRLTPFCPFRAKAYVCDFRCIATVPASFHSPLQQLVNQHIDASLWAYCPSGQQGSERGRAFPTCFPMTLRSLETLVTLRTLSDGSRHYATRFGVEMGGGLSRWCPLRGYHRLTPFCPFRAKAYGCDF